MNNSAELYKSCDYIKTKPQRTDQEFYHHIETNYRTMPTYEKTLFELTYTKHYSLQTNELLKCRWDNYKNNLEKKVFAPFQFPKHGDLHIFNGIVRYLPSQTTTRRKDFKMKMSSGPRVDSLGQLPIPNELLMVRSKSNVEATKKKQIVKDRGSVEQTKDVIEEKKDVKEVEKDGKETKNITKKAVEEAKGYGKESKNNTKKAVKEAKNQRKGKH